MRRNSFSDEVEIGEDSKQPADEDERYFRSTVPIHGTINTSSD